MASIKKRIIAAAIGATILSASMPSQAIIPQTNYANLGQSIVNNLQEMLNHEMWMAIKDQVMEQASSMAALEIDNTNNAWANVIVRQGAAKQEVQNIEVTKWSTPAFNPGKTLGLSINIYCNEGKEVADKEASDKDYVSEEEAGEIKANGGTAKTFKDVQDEIIERFNGGEGVCSNLTESTTESPLNPKPLISDTPDEQSLSPDSEQAIYDYIDLVAPPYVASYRDKSRSKEADETLKIKNAEMESIYAFPRVMLLKLMSKRSVSYSETGLSEITTLEEFAEQHYGKGSSSNSNISGKIMLSNLAVPSVVWRNLAVMKAFQVHMSVLKFKSNLDKEAIQAINLAFEARKNQLNIDNQTQLDE